MRSLIVFSSAYLTLFVFHIVFAANDLDALFRMVATILVAMTFLCGPVLWLIAIPQNEEAFVTGRIGFFVSLPLSLGIAYAYTDMNFEIGASATALLLTTLTHGIWFLTIRAK